jgi:uncharacterized protein YfaS (alpha-2-macroglobulin family)
MLNRFATLIKSVGLWLLEALDWLGKTAAWCFHQLFGSFSWQAPNWMVRLGLVACKFKTWLSSNPKRSAGLGLVAVILAVSAVLGWNWYRQLPKPVLTHYNIKPPALTEYDEKGRAKPYPFVIEFDESAAPVSMIQKAVPTGITLSPSIEGVWTWDDEQTLSFRPKTDWPIDAEFNVSLAKHNLLAEQIKLDNYHLGFRTAPFTAEIKEASFYQDPIDPNLKKLVATAHFSHPVDSDHFADKVKLVLAGGLSFQGLGGKPESTVSYDEFKLNAYIHSAPLAIPKEDSKLELTLAEGIQSIRGGNETAGKLTQDITVPGLYHLQFDNFRMTLVDNERFEPEQVLLIDSSAAVNVATLKDKVQAWLLPEFNPNTPVEERVYPYHWNDSEVTRDLLAASESVTLTKQPSENEFEQLHGFKFHAPVGRMLYVKVNQGIQAFGGYQARTPSMATVEVQPYPKAVKLLSQGALLSLNGERKLAYMTRGLSGVKIEIGRLLPNQLHHLVDQSNGGFAQPDIGDYVLDTLVERFIENRPLVKTEFGKPSYDSIDFANYLHDQSHATGGVFMVKLQDYDPENPEDRHSDVTPDTRFILVTDLGIIAKRGVDGSQDVFVQSIAGGEPVAGAKVDVVSRNGQVVLTQTTDDGGHVRFPHLSDLQREKKALMYVVSHENDLSFLPINRDERKINLSRFDIGGLDNALSPQQLSSFVFTDRGIYRPGESAHIGMIVRTADWSGSLEGIPLEASITDPRGLEILKQRINLSADGFESIDYNSRETSHTGEYHVGLFLIRNNARDRQIGSAVFKVRDFEPDRIKVNVKLAEQRAEGWITPEQAKAQVTAMQLFGSPANDRRVEAEMTLSPAIPAFEKYKDFSFKDQFKHIEPFTEKLTASMTNADGQAELNLNLQRFARATYRLYLSAKVFEASGGRSVSSDAAMLVSSAPYLVGVKADGMLSYIPRDAARNSRWLAVDSGLKPVAADKLTLQLIERTYISVLVKQNNETYKYESRKKEVVRESKPYTLASGGADLALNTAEPGDFALVLKDADGAELNRLEYSVAGEANLSRSLERNAELQLNLNKSEYNPGDTIEINIRAPYTGSGLITVERDHVFHHAWFKTNATSSVQRITLPKDFEGNGYVSVQFVRDPGSDEIFMSPLSYGVIPFSVNLDARREPINFTAAKSIKPGQTLDMHIDTAAPARVVVFAVDEGILQVARYKKPDPIGFFFQKRALQVNTTQILDMILPEFQRLMNAAAPGGDGDTSVGRHLNPFKKKHKAPVAWWSGLIDVGPEGKQLHYDVPDSFNGKLHLFAVAVSANRIGVYDGETEVRGDMILSPNVPLSATPGDEFLVSVGVFNNLQEKGDKADQAVTPVTISLSPSAGIKLISNAETVLNIAGQKEAVAEFKVHANDILGPADLQFVAKAKDKEIHALESISIRPAAPFRTQLTMGRFDGGDKVLDINRNLYLQHRNVQAGISLSPLVWAQGLSDYLQEYQHSCTEQLVSKAIPALVLSRSLDFASNRHALEQGLQVLRERQNEDGSFGLWAANFQVDNLVSAYAVHYLVELKERGEAPPADMLANANRWLEQLAADGSDGLDGVRTRAYAIYLLTRQGVVTSGLLATLQQELDDSYAEQWPEDLTAAYLAASYKLLQQDALASKIIKAVPWSHAKKTPGAGYYDPLVHDAQLLYLLSRHFRDRLGDIPEQAIGNMGDAISANRYHTLSSAYMILGFDAYGAAGANDAVKLAISEIDEKGKLTESVLKGGAIGTAEVSPNAGKLKFGKEGKAPAFYMLSENGYDRKPLPAVTQGLEIAREFIGLDGAHLENIKVGEEFLVKLTFRSTDRDSASQVAIVDLLPGGIEPVVNAKPESSEPPPVEGEESEEQEDQQENKWQAPIGEGSGSNWWPEYADVRDDRVVLYGTLQRNVGTFIYRVRTTNAGAYNVPPPFAEGMYDRRLLARGVASMLQVAKP